jgi:hypothetical protein
MRCSAHTTASADFSPTLVAEISPGKVQNLSPRAARLYLTRLDELWASLFPASLPPASGLTADSCSCGREFATRFSQLHLALRLAVHYGYRHRFRLAPFIQLDSAHAGHTGVSASPCRWPSGQRFHSEKISHSLAIRAASDVGDALRRFCCDRKASRLPCRKSAGQVGDVLKTLAPQQAGGDRTSKAALTVHDQKFAPVQFRYP